MRRLILALFIPALVSCSTVETDPIEDTATGVYHPLIGDEIGLDHVLLWSSDHAAAEKRLEELGFTLSEKTGSYGAGISNRIIWFENWSFIEFLWLSDPQTARLEAPREYEFATTINGSNAFGVSIADADVTYEELARSGLSPDRPDAEVWDPDGPDGPQEPVENEWRFMFMNEGSLPGNPFFVQYKKKTNTPRSETHPNGALKVSAVWLVVSDLERAKAAYGRAHFVETSTFKSLDENAVSLFAGQGEIFLIQPTTNSLLINALQTRGDHVYGVSVQVADLAATERYLTRRGVPISRTGGRSGASLMVAPRDPVGLHIEFHE